MSEREFFFFGCVCRLRESIKTSDSQGCTPMGVPLCYENRIPTIQVFKPNSYVEKKIFLYYSLGSRSLKQIYM